MVKVHFYVKVGPQGFTFYGLRMVSAISIFLATLAMSLGGIRAAKFLHSTMLTRILRSPMSFFDTTPLGRVINRFSKDIDSIDYTFPTIIRAVMSYILEVNKLCFDELVPDFRINFVYF